MLPLATREKLDRCFILVTTNGFDNTHLADTWVVIVLMKPRLNDMAALS